MPILEREPTKPGVYIKEDILEVFELTQDELAQLLETDRIAINQLVKGRRAITAEMALRLGKLTRTSARFWLNLQQSLDLWRAKQKSKKLPLIQPLR